MHPVRALSEDEAKIMDAFAAGERTLFVIKARGKAVQDLGFFDITAQKVSGDEFGIMLWKEAHVAERFILEHGWTDSSEVFEVRVGAFWEIVQSVYRNSACRSAKYVLY